MDQLCNCVTTISSWTPCNFSVRSETPLRFEKVTEYYIYLGDSPQPAKTLDNSTFPWTGLSADHLILEI